MEIILHIEARKLDNDYKKASDEYIKRMSFFACVKIICHKNLKEASLTKGSYVINVNPAGEKLSSTDLAGKINDICVNGYSRIEIIISNNFTYENADLSLAISTLKMEEQLTLTALCEQLYRAFTIQNNITYHK